MIRLLDCKNANYISRLNLFLEKRRLLEKSNNKIVRKIITDVKKNKVKALLKYENQYSKNKELRPSEKQKVIAIKSLNPSIKKAIDFAYSRILKFHLKQVKEIKNISYIDNLNNKLEYKYVPIESIGIYVPGNLPSTLLMNSIPAKLANVKRIVLATPKINGKLNPAILYAAKKVGIKEIYSIGGAQAIASLAFIQKVNKVVGPGNQFVAEAKRILSGKIIGTESMFAGPSEICILADKNTSFNQIITSLISQAEHDPNSQCILITKDKKILDNVKKQIPISLKNIPRKKIAYKSLKDYGLLIKAYSDNQILNLINEIAPEHLELNVKNFKKYSKKIYNVGSICNGKFSPMSASDYTVGTNHILPTSGSAKFSSGLNVAEFYKKISHITLSKKGVEVIGNKAITLAEYEGLFGHAQSIKSRIRSS